MTSRGSVNLLGYRLQASGSREESARTPAESFCIEAQLQARFKKGSVRIMERGSLEKLKFDKRLRRRQGWVSDRDIEDHLKSLPDVSDKIAVESDESAEESAEQSTEQSIEQSIEQQAAAAATPSEGMARGVAEPGAMPADEFGDRPVDPLSPPPFKEV